MATKKKAKKKKPSKTKKVVKKVTATKAGKTFPEEICEEGCSKESRGEEESCRQEDGLENRCPAGEAGSVDSHNR